MPKHAECAKLVVVNGWGLCPKCGRKCLKVLPDTRLDRLPLFCKRCKQTTLVKLDNFLEPEPLSPCR